MKLKSIFDKLDWLAELPRFGCDYPSAGRMSPTEYGVKLLIGLVIVICTALFCLGVVGLGLTAIAFFAIYCPSAFIASASILAIAIGIGWLRKTIA